MLEFLIKIIAINRDKFNYSNIKGASNAFEAFTILNLLPMPQVDYIINWIKPNNNVIKINTNGYVAHNSWQCGGIIRDYKGNIIFFFCLSFK